jgi:YgiT-type zinc finger domain-containing protein
MGSQFYEAKGYKIMKCISCGAKTFTDITTDVTDIMDCLIIVRNVPCHKCSECNEILYTGDVVKRLEGIVDLTKNALNEIAVVDYNNKVA